jgi:ATP-dependent Lon protease
MSDALDKVRGVRELPLFPLPLVLFPGVPLPLHVFEERYRRLLEDVRVSNNLFGLSYFDPNAVGALERPEVGHVGCATEVVEVQPLPDGRSNILTVGVARYRITDYVESGEPYLVARVEFFEDEESDAALLGKRAAEVAEMFTRIARAMRSINDERGELPQLPLEDPERLSFLVAAVVEMEAEAKQQLLELRSTAERLRRVYALLAQAVSSYEARAHTHELARGNGHGGKRIDLE